MNPRRILWVVVLLLGATASAQATEVVVYYHTDALHSVTTITNAQGQVIERTHYAPYGQVLNRALRDGPGYAGHQEDAATGLVYMQQRYYDPESGTFLSADPVEANAGAGFNRYAYANDNPYRYTDPDGRQDCVSSGCKDSEQKDQSTVGCTGSATGKGCDSQNVKVIQMADSPVQGNAKMDAAATALLNSGNSGSTNEQGDAVYDDGSKSPMTQCSNSKCQQTIDANHLAFIAHWHVSSILDDPRQNWIETQMRELPGPKDHLVVESPGVPNYFRTPTGAIRVLEYSGHGRFSVRTVEGVDFKYQNQYSPGENINIYRELMFDYDRSH